jgi:hypothetical protein
MRMTGDKFEIVAKKITYSPPQKPPKGKIILVQAIKVEGGGFFGSAGTAPFFDGKLDPNHIRWPAYGGQTSPDGLTMWDQPQTGSKTNYTFQSHFVGIVSAVLVVDQPVFKQTILGSVHFEWDPGPNLTVIMGNGTNQILTRITQNVQVSAYAPNYGGNTTWSEADKNK